MSGNCKSEKCSAFTKKNSYNIEFLFTIHTV